MRRLTAVASGLLMVAALVTATALWPDQQPAALAILVPDGLHDEAPYLWAGCSASVAANGVVVTAAHCVHADDPPWRAITGVTDLCQPLPEIAVVSEPLRLVARDEHSDIAVLVTPEAEREALAQPPSEPSPGAILEVWGYGARSVAGPRACTPHHAMQVVVDRAECHAAGVEATVKLCVRNGSDGDGVCTGDSGGPVYADGHLVGVTSSGVDCVPGSIGTVALMAR